MSALYLLTEVSPAQGHAWSKALGDPAGGFPVFAWREDKAWRVWPELRNDVLVRNGRRPVAWRAER